MGLDPSQPAAARIYDYLLGGYFLYAHYIGSQVPAKGGGHAPK